MYAKCAKCGHSSVKGTAICSKCGTGFPLCENCKSIWKSYQCPKCGTVWANWNFTGFEEAKAPTQAATSTVVIGSAMNAQDIFFANKGSREISRNQDGTTKHYGVELEENDVLAIRELEDSIFVEIQEHGSNTIKVENKQIIELNLNSFIAKEEQLASIGKLKHLKTLRMARDDRWGYIKHISDKISECESLEAASLRGMSIDSFPKFPKSLKKLRINNWDWDKPFPQLADVLKLEQLVELNLQSNNIDATVFANGIGNLKNLVKLSLAHTKGITELPESITKLEKLEELDVNGSGVKNWPKYLEKMKSIKLVHTNKDQASALSFGNIKKALEKNNPTIYPKLGLKDKIKAGVQSAADKGTLSMSDIERKWKENLPEPLKKGWSGIT